MSNMSSNKIIKPNNLPFNPQFDPDSSTVTLTKRTVKISKDGEYRPLSDEPFTTRHANPEAYDRIRDELGVSKSSEVSKKPKVRNLVLDFDHGVEPQAPSTARTNHELLREIALNSYGYGGWNTGEKGGTGNIGLYETKDGEVHVVKFNTSKDTVIPNKTDDEYKASLEASNRLRTLLANIAQTSDLPAETLKEIRDKLSVDADNKPLRGTALLERKTAAAVLKMIDKDIWTWVKPKAHKAAYSSGASGWKPENKGFAAMTSLIEGGNAALESQIGDFAGFDVTLDRLNSDLASGVVRNAVEAAQKERGTAVSFGTISLFEGAVQDAVIALEEKEKLSKDKIAQELNQDKMTQFLNLAALASGKGGGNDEVRKAFATIRKKEAGSPDYAGLMRQTLAKLLVAGAKGEVDLAHVSAEQIESAQAEVENGKDLPAKDLADRTNVQKINSLSREVLDPNLVPVDFSRAFTTKQQRADAVAILKKLNTKWKKHAFFVTGLACPLIQKAVIEARKFQPDDKPLSDETIYAALVGKLPADNGNKDLFEAVDERVRNDFSAYADANKKGWLTSEPYNYVSCASEYGIKYDSILEALRHPGRMPTAHDFYDASIRPMRQAKNRKHDTPDARYNEFLFRRVASCYTFKGGKKKSSVDSAPFYGKEGEEVAQTGRDRVTGFMKNFKSKEAQEMVSDLLMQHIGERFFLATLGTDIRYNQGSEDTKRYLRALRNYSNFTFTKEGEGEDERYRLVVTPNRESLKDSNLFWSDVDYEIEFLIDKEGNAWVTKQWVGEKEKA